MAIASAVMAASAVAVTTTSGLIPALYAAVGAIVGGAITAAAGLMATYYQQRVQGRRDLVRMAVDLGSAEYAHDLESARARSSGELVAPIASYVLIEYQMLKILSEKGSVTADEISAIGSGREKLLAAFPGYPGRRNERSEE